MTVGMEPDVSEPATPGITGIHHFSVTVTDLEASLAWYQRLLGAEHVPMNSRTMSGRTPATASYLSNRARAS
jgi:hypothetical protein